LEDFTFERIKTQIYGMLYVHKVTLPEAKLHLKISFTQLQPQRAPGVLS